MNINYDFKPLAEGVRAVALAGIVAALQVFLAGSPDKLFQPETWGLAVATAGVLAAGHALLSILSR